MNEELKIIITAQVNQAKQAVSDVKNEIKSFQEQVKKAGADVDKHFKNIGASIKAGFQAGLTAIAAVGASLVALGISTREYRAEQALLVSAFENAGHSAEQAKTTYNDLYRVLGDTGTATEAAQHLAKLKVGQEELAEYTNICQGVYATFGASLPLEGLTEAVNHTVNLGEVQGTLADALEWSGVNVDDFNDKLAECNSESEREKLIRDTLNGLYSEAAATYEKNNADILKQREAQSKLNDTLASLGKTMEPIITAFTVFASEALAVVAPYIEQLATDLVPVLTVALEGAVAAMKTAFEWASEHKTLLGVIAGVIATVVAAIGLYNTVAAVKAAIAAAEVVGVLGLVSAYLAQAAAMVVAIAPYILMVAAIAAVIAVIVLAIKNWDKIKETVVNVSKAVWNSVKEMKDKVVSYFTDMGNNAKQKVADLKNSVVAKFAEVQTNISNKVAAARSALSSGFSNMASSAASYVSNIVSNVSSKFESIRNKISSSINSAKDTVKNAVNSIKNAFNFSWKLPDLKIPHISVSGGKAPFGIGGLGSLPQFSIKWYAQGGVFDKATLFHAGGGIGGLGEDGAEAIVPLEKNLAWLDRLAEMLNSRMSTNVPVVLKVGEKVFAETVINTVNNNTKQTGELGLIIR